MDDHLEIVPEATLFPQSNKHVEPETAFSNPETAFSNPETAFSNPETAFSNPDGNLHVAEGSKLSVADNDLSEKPVKTFPDLHIKGQDSGVEVVNTGDNSSGLKSENTISDTIFIAVAIFILYAIIAPKFFNYINKDSKNK